MARTGAPNLITLDVVVTNEGTSRDTMAKITMLDFHENAWDEDLNLQENGWIWKE